jgi:hypothetical protein
MKYDPDCTLPLARRERKGSIAETGGPNEFSQHHQHAPLGSRGHVVHGAPGDGEHRLKGRKLPRGESGRAPRGGSY